MNVPVDHVVAAILDGPVAAIGGEDGFGRGLFGRVTGDAQGQFGGE